MENVNYSQKAQVALQKNDYVTAIQLLQKALRSNPESFAVLNNLGFAFFKQGRFMQALELFKKALSINKLHAQIYDNLAQTYMALADFELAKNHEKQAIELSQNNANYYINLITILTEMKDVKSAIEYSQKLIKKFPQHSSGYLKLTDLYMKVGDYQKAEQTLHSVKAITPDNFYMDIIEGRLLKAQKKYEEATKIFDKVIKASNSNIHLKASAAALLAQIYQSQEKYQEAYALVSEYKEHVANDPTIKSMSKKSPLINVINKINQWLDKKTMAQWSPEPVSDDMRKPIFLIGFPRSGTTLLEQMFAVHSETVTTGELSLLNTVIDFIQSNYCMGLPYLEVVDKLTEIQIQELRALYKEQAQKRLFADLTQKVMIDKTPLNIIHLNLIKKLFPDSAVVFSIRDPRDVCLSCLFQDFDLNIAMQQMLTMESIVNFYVLVMTLWRKYQTQLKMNIVEYRYEDLTLKREEVLKKIMQACQLDLEPAQLEHQKKTSQHFISTPSADAVRQPVYQFAQKRWRHYEKDLEPYIPKLKPFIKLFGYNIVD